MASRYRYGLAGQDFERFLAERLGRLRHELAARGLDGFIGRAPTIIRGVCPHLVDTPAWLTGLPDRAGLAIDWPRSRGLFVRRRYRCRLAAQVDTVLFEIRHRIEEPPAAGSARRAQSENVLAYDPWLDTPHESSGFAFPPKRPEGCPWGSIIRSTGVAVRPSAPYRIRWCRIPSASAGERCAYNQTAPRLGRALREEGAAAVVLTMPESIGMAPQYPQA